MVFVLKDLINTVDEKLNKFKIKFNQAVIDGGAKFNFANEQKMSLGVF